MNRKPVAKMMLQIDDGALTNDALFKKLRL